MSMIVNKSGFSVSFTSAECQLDANSKRFTYLLKCPLELKHCTILLGAQGVCELGFLQVNNGSWHVDKL